MSIKYKILLPLLFMVLLAITTISYFYVNDMNSYIKSSSTQKLELLGEVTNEKVNLYVQQMKDKVEFFNTRKFLYEKLLEYDKSKNSDIKSIVEGILKFSYSKEKDIVNILVLDSAFNVIAAKRQGETLKNSFLSDIKKTTRMTPLIKLIFKNIKTVPMLYISAPILKDKKLIGTTVFVITLSYLNDILTKNNKIGKTGEILMGIKSNDKLVIFTPMKESPYPKVCLNKNFVQYIFKENHTKDFSNQTIREAYDYRKQHVIFSLHYNKLLEVMILVKEDMAELMQPVDKIKYFQYIVLFVSILLITLASILIARQMLKVIDNIVRITSNISNGKFDERIDITTKDELGVLAKSVNKMADIMINANAISEAKVVEKTKLLQESNSELQQLSIQLKETVIKLENHNENLSIIIKSLSHDIKTPLTIINGYLEEIDDGLVECEDISNVTAILKKETAYLNELTSEVIGYIQSKETTVITREVIPLKDFFQDEIYPILRVASQVDFVCHFSSEDKIIFNRIALKKIFINLLHNASKYTIQGYIATSMHCNSIYFEDTGIGIDAQFATKIFEPFVALDESRNREKNGFGLGLSIAQNLAKTNGYNLRIDSSYTKGSRFILERILITRAPVKLQQKENIK